MDYEKDALNLPPPQKNKKKILKFLQVFYTHLSP